MSVAHYDDPEFSYEKYWHNRAYEHAAEEIALTKLLKGKKFTNAVDIGGGYGRLSTVLQRYANHVTLVEPSQKQRTIAKRFLKDFPQITIKSGLSDKTQLEDNSQDLAMMVRVTHHLPDLKPTLAELSRVLKPKGLLILEVANSRHFKAWIKSLATGQPILPMPVERRSSANIRKNTIAFVNHHPGTVSKLLAQSGFKISRSLSVSNFRSPQLKKFLPKSILLNLESATQTPLARINFGPSIFLLCHKST